MEHFNLTEGLRYTWPRFLKHQGRCSVRFWNDLRDELLQTLNGEVILQSRYGNEHFSRPDELLYIPPEFRLGGEPLIENANTEKKYLSFNYDSDSLQLPPELAAIGVKVIGYRSFFREFKSCIKKKGVEFLKNCSSEWHSNVARILRSSNDFKRELAGLPLIPLRDGRWVCHSEKNLFLDAKTTNFAVPNGIDINLVDSEACKDKERKKFFRWLGITACDQAVVCKLILDLHMKGRKGGIQDFISDAIYLFLAHDPTDELQLQNLKFVDHSMCLGSGDRFYIDEPSKAIAISKYSEEEESGVRMLHPEYFAAVQDLGKEHAFIKWLMKNCQFSTLPRLVRGNQLTQEFGFFTTKAAGDLLFLLRDNWDHYSNQIHKSIRRPGASGFTSAKEELSKMMVECVDGVSRPLGQTILPLSNLKIQGSYLPVLDIPNPTDPRWLDFETLGVITGENLDLYLRQLKAMSVAEHSPQVEDVREIYRQLAARSISDVSSVR